MSNNIPLNYILCAQGGLGNDHDGNKYYCALIAASKDLYLRGSHAENNKLVQSIFDTLKSKEYQFMRLNKKPNQYEKVGDNRVMKKIAQCFCDMNNPAKAKPQHVHASNSPDDDHLSDVSSSQGSSSL